jgi:hypothetical protein
MQAKQLINSQLPSYFNLITRLDFKAFNVIILFKERLKLIINPFLLKLYMFSVIILYFLIIIIS